MRERCVCGAEWEITWQNFDRENPFGFNDWRNLHAACVKRRAMIWEMEIERMEYQLAKMAAEMELANASVDVEPNQSFTPSE